MAAEVIIMVGVEAIITDGATIAIGKTACNFNNHRRVG